MYGNQRQLVPGLLLAGGIGHITWVEQLAEWAGSARALRMVFLLMGIWIINAFDLVFTIQAHRDGMLHEDNPLARWVLNHGAVAVTTFKAVLVLGSSWVLYHYRRRLCAEAAAATALGVYALVAVRWKLCYDAYDLAYSAGATQAELARLDLNIPDSLFF